jgi:ABC-type glutathione transport system ATPase component
VTDSAITNPLIRLREVTKNYDTGSGPFTALLDVDLSVPRGAFVAIVGRSGSGKSPSRTSSPESTGRRPARSKWPGRVSTR